MLYKFKNNRTFVEQHSTRYDNAYTEVRGKFVCNRAQATCQDSEVRQDARQDNPAREHHSRCGQEWKETDDRPRSGHSIQHIRHYSSECPDLLWGEGTRRNIEPQKEGDTSCRSKGDRRSGGAHHRFGARGSSGRICEMDSSPSCRQIGQTWVCRFDFSYAGRSHSKKTNISLI